MDPTSSRPPRSRPASRCSNRGTATAAAFDVSLLLSTKDRPERTRTGFRGVVAEIGRLTVPAGLGAGRDVLRVFEGRIPAGLVAGTYALVAMADPVGALRDLRRDDNVGTIPVRVLARAVLRSTTPGLALDRGESAPGETFGVAATLRNEGNVPTSAASITISLVGGDPRERRREDRLLAAMPLDGVRPGETRELRLTAALPPSTPRGRARVVLRLVTPGADVEDLDEATIVIRFGGTGVDLVAHDARVEPARARSGGGIRVTAKISNLGDRGSSATAASLDLSSAAGEIRLAKVDLPPLDARGSIELPFLARLPRDLPAGRSWLRVRVDPDGRVAQTDRDNDVTWIALDVEGRFERDLRASIGPLALGEGSRSRPGRPIDLSTRIDNRGEAAIEGLEVEAVLVARDGTTRSLGRRPASIDGGRGAFLDFADRFVLPGDLAPGEYVLRFLLDPDQRMPWADASPVAETGVTVDPATDPCDLAPVALDFDRRVLLGGRRIAVEAMILNRGPGTAPEFDVELALGSTDLSRRSYWLPLMTRRLEPGIRAGVQTRARFDVVLPAEIPDGEYRVVVTVDPWGLVDPSRAADNALGRDVRIGGSEPAPAPAPVPTPMPLPPTYEPPRPLPAPPPAPAPLPSPTAPPSAPTATSTPLLLAVLTANNELVRETGTSAAFLVHFPTSAAGPFVLEVALETGGGRYPLGEFDVPGGGEGTPGVARGRLRVPSSVGAGAATLVLTLRPETGPGARAPVRLPIAVR